MAEKVIWTATAREDLHAIAVEIARDRPSLAERFCLELIEQADLAGDFPRAGRKLPELDDENVREILKPPYRIIDEMFPNEPRPAILRVWHSARGTPELARNKA